MQPEHQRKRRPPAGFSPAATATSTGFSEAASTSAAGPAGSATSQTTGAVPYSRTTIARMITRFAPGRTASGGAA